MGAGMAVSEMVASNSLLWGSGEDHPPRQPRGRGRAEGDPDRRRRAGNDGRGGEYNVDKGADIIDINMGCPAKKICNVAAGSALLKDEPLVAASSTPW
jgi:tRNA-dihydrouridine synthase B